jgi:hypothetical protein
MQQLFWPFFSQYIKCIGAWNFAQRCIAAFSTNIFSVNFFIFLHQCVIIWVFNLSNVLCKQSKKVQANQKNLWRSILIENTKIYPWLKFQVLTHFMFWEKKIETINLQCVTTKITFYASWAIAQLASCCGGSLPTQSSSLTRSKCAHLSLS